MLLPTDPILGPKKPRKSYKKLLKKSAKYSWFPQEQEPIFLDYDLAVRDMNLFSVQTQLT